MSITDELREWAEDNTLRDRVLTTYPPQHAVHGVLETLLRIADRIDAAYEGALVSSYFDGVFSDGELAENGFIRLPKDADGEPIRMGDVMEWVRYKDDDPTIVRTVSGIGNSVFFAWSDEQGRYAQYEAHAYRHHHAPTVEDVLTEFGIDWEHESDCEDRAALLKEYASKFRLADDGKGQ